MRPPEFWRTDAFPAAALSPLGALYAAAAAWRERATTPYRAAVPVVGVGNLTLGGGGKTPTVQSVTQLLQNCGMAPQIVSRGYGGRLRGPVRVDPTAHSAAEVGDEPLLLARAAPTWIAKRRAEGVRAAEADNADLVLLDDGLQNPSVGKTVRLVVVNGGEGFGNARVFPAGPLRESLARGLGRADGIVLIGRDETGVRPRLPAGVPVFGARLEPVADAALTVENQKVFGFAGIAHPARFAATLRTLGADLRGFRAFADHQPYDAKALRALENDAARAGAVLATTEKDAVRLPPAFRARVRVVPVALVFGAPAVFVTWLRGVLG